jgi:cell division septation protein DedD
MKRAALIFVALLMATPAHAWQPPSSGPSKMAKRVLDSLADPMTVRIPPDVVARSRARQASKLPVEDISRSTGGVLRNPAPTPGGCWEVQLTALSDANRADEMAAREQSLGVPVHVVTEDGLSKLRAGGPCLLYDEARALRDRWMSQGYPGAFVIRVSSSGS